MSSSLITVIEIYDPLGKVWTPEFGDLVLNPDFPEEDSEQWITPHRLARLHVFRTGESEDERKGLYGFDDDNSIYAVLGWSGAHPDGPVPMMPLMGLPKDVSAAAATLMEQDRAVAYDASYLTLADMQSYDWDQRVPGWMNVCLRECYRLNRLREVMARMAELGAPDRVRMVFWFTC